MLAKLLLIFYKHLYIAVRYADIDCGYSVIFAALSAAYLDRCMIGLEIRKCISTYYVRCVCDICAC